MNVFSKPQHIRATVIEKTQLTANVFRARYALMSPQSMKFLAGQTISITVAPNTFRVMSIASPPQEDTILTSFQDVSPGGPGSKWMESLRVGDMLEFMAPLGRFVIDHESPRKRVLVATGTGIAPFRSMLLDSSDGIHGQKDLSLYWGLRYKEDIYIQEELATLDEDYENLKYYFVLSKPPDDWSGLSGHVTDHVFTNEKDIGACDFYLCGNKQMILEMQDRLTTAGVPKEHMKFDPFF